MADEQDLVVLRDCRDHVEAASLRAILESAGIECVSQGETHRSMLGVMGPYIEVRVLVAPRDLERATALLRELESTTDAALEAAVTDDQANLPASDEENESLTPEEAAKASQLAWWVLGGTAAAVGLLVVWLKQG